MTANPADLRSSEESNSSDSVGTDYTGRRVTVMGLGRFGGGLGAVQFLLSRGARVSVTDLRPPEDLTESLAQFDSGRLKELVLGEHPERLFTDADLVVVNPAVRRNHPLLELARARNIPLTSEMNLFWTHLGESRERQATAGAGSGKGRERIIGVTGSNGKSTTTALIHHLLLSAGERAWLGGNLGGSLLPQIDRIGPDDWVVLELSSFMLADLDRLRRSPSLAVVTSFAPNHLDWHPDLDDYRRAKQTILRWQSAEDVAVLNADDPDVRGWPTRGSRLWFGESLLPGAGIRVVGSRLECSPVEHGPGELVIDLAGRFSPPGRHNRWNAAAAVAAVRTLGLTDGQIAAGLETFTGLPHRLQLVAEGEGRRFYNDSLATTPESAICALEAFDSPVVLLAGGYDKKVDLGRFAEEVARRAKGVALLGQTGPKLEQLLAEIGSSIPRHLAADLADGMAWAVSRSAPGDVVLLSPACASFDWFRNFAERGERFTELAERWCREATRVADSNS